MTEQPPAPVEERPAHARHGAAGWLVLVWLLATAGRFAWTAWSRFGEPAVPWWSKIATAAVALLALAAVVPLLRFRRSGWEMAVWVLVTAVVMDLALIVLGTRQWIAVTAAAGASAFCLGYLWRARAAFTGHDEDWEEVVDADHPPAADDAADTPRRAAVQAGADPVADALGAIHRRIVDAGSACAVSREALLEDAVRHGLRPVGLASGRECQPRGTAGEVFRSRATGCVGDGSARRSLRKSAFVKEARCSASYRIRDTPVILRERSPWSPGAAPDSAARPKNLPPLARNPFPGNARNRVRGKDSAAQPGDSSVGARLSSRKESPARRLPQNDTESQN